VGQRAAAYLPQYMALMLMFSFPVPMGTWSPQIRVLSLPEFGSVGPHLNPPDSSEEFRIPGNPNSMHLLPLLAACNAPTSGLRVLASGLAAPPLVACKYLHVGLQLQATVHLLVTFLQPCRRSPLPTAGLLIVSAMRQCCLKCM